MELVKIRNSQELSDHLKISQDARLSFEKQITKEFSDKKNWSFIGFCEPCGKETKFLGDWNYSDGITPNFRESLVCPSCGLNNRQRFMIGLLQTRIKQRKQKIDSIYLYEQITNFYSYVKKNFKDINIVGSEYLGSEKTSGEIINDIRHEDALNLSFKNESFDLLISNDVFEHVPDINKTLSESYRVLKKDGSLFTSIPFTFREQTTQRAIIENGTLKHLLPEQYHGNPVSEKGSLVFYDYGWDFLDFCTSAGFKDAYLLLYYSYSYAYIGNGSQIMFIAEK